MSARDMRPRWQSAILLLTLPITILPILIWIGWKESGRDIVGQIMPGIRWVFLGRPFE